MPLTWRERSLLMEWCLDCHREPERYVRPREAIFRMDWVPASIEEGRALVRQYRVRRLTDCDTCHR
jgi:hypothetical protein